MAADVDEMWTMHRLGRCGVTFDEAVKGRLISNDREAWDEAQGFGPAAWQIEGEAPATSPVGGDLLVVDMRLAGASHEEIQAAVKALHESGKKYVRPGR